MAPSAAVPVTENDAAAAPATRRQDVQGLRAVAVVLVVLGHMGFPGVTGGYVGVDVFFVISGFLITGLLVREASQERGISFSDFYARRARRILPAATLVLLTTVLTTYFLLGRTRVAEIARETIWAALSAANWKFAREGTDYFASDLPPSPLQHYWSLGVEEQFYLLWPGVLFVALFAFATPSLSQRGRFRRAPSTTRWRVLLALLLAVAVASFLYSVSYTVKSPGGAYFSTLTRTWELAVGAVLAVAIEYVRDLPDRMKATMSWAGMVGILVSATTFDADTAFPGSAALLPVLAAALVLAGGSEGPRYGAVALLGTRPFSWMGDRSYSLYLWHWPALILTAAYLGHDLGLAQSTAVIAVALLLTMITYSLVERPIHLGVVPIPRPGALAMWPATFLTVSLVALLCLDSIRSGDTIAPTAAGFDLPATSSPASATPPPATAPTTGAGSPTSAATASSAETVQTAAGALPGQPSADDPIGQAVAAAVAAADNGEAIPEVLFPAIDEVRDDTWKDFTPTSCFAVLDQASSEICSFGPDSAPRSMVIFGNSIAGMWLAPLKQIAEENDWKLYFFVKTACPVAGLVTWNETDTANHCPQWRDWALGEIARLRPDVAMLSTRGDSTFLAANRFGGNTWEQGMVATIDALKQVSPRVVVFSETPEAAKDPVGCLDRPGATMADCTWDMDPSVAAVIAADARAAATSGVQFLDLIPWFCVDNRCPLVVADMVVSYGSEHVTNTYGLALSDRLAAALALS